MNKAIGWQLKAGLFCVVFTMVAKAYAEPSANLYSAIPPLLKKAADPLVMLVMSVDHALFKKAYSDYSDLDNDGVLDTTYNDAFDYAGYFDSQWCYDYNEVKGYYQPIAQAEGTHQHFCNSGSSLWSGNFLNWATMSRMDMLRKTLFGGKRFRDSDAQTVLERAYLPRDLHSFVKVYRGTTAVPVSRLTPFNKPSISLCNLTVTENGPPTVRVASQAWPRWALTEEKQCQWGNQHSPSSLFKLAEHNVYIESCITGKEAEDASYCKSYQQGRYKPIGLLQRYGDIGSVQFGLISGSYDKNSSGGVLRKNIAPLASNSDSSKDEVNLETGVFNGAVKGIVHHLSTFRIAKYSYSSNGYLDCNLPDISVDTYLSEPSRATGSDRHCSNWGNPLAEMYLEALRYFSDMSRPSPEYDTEFDNYFLSGLSKDSWSNPQDGSNACASCSIIVFSSGLNSFDTDEFARAGDVPGITGSGGVNRLTDEVGTMEAAINPNIHFPGTFLADKSGGSRYCESVNISKLSDVRGLCPEQPQLEGGYSIAGLAWHGRKTDLRPDLDGQQFVKTYAVELAENLPSFSIDVAGTAVTFQPVCEAYSHRSACTLIEVVVDYLAVDRSRGRFLFFWEDSLFGNDYDYDASSSIEYCVGSACSPVIGASQIQLSVRQEEKSAGVESWYSYTMTGTNNTGIATPFAQGAGSAGNQGQGMAVTTIFDAAGNSATQLPRPLWFAAKYGGFTDFDNDFTPHHDGDHSGFPDAGDSREWDSRNNLTGVVGADGLPDNYFFSQNPRQLELQLGRALQDISSRAAAVANLTVVANTTKGDSTVYQALFQPKLEQNSKVVTWGGMLHSLFIDQQGWLREDSNGNGKLDDYGQDKVIEIVDDANTGQTMIQHYAVNNAKKIPLGTLKPLHQLNPLWDARESLADLNNLTSQRSYSAMASGGRYILTWLDDNNNQTVDAGEIKPFIADTFQRHAGYLGVSETLVSDTVNYIRGEEITGFRSRTIDYDVDGVAEVWRLGDIVHSQPVAVSTPSGVYDARFRDSSYKAFKEKYDHRRHVVYVGANDGLIHAFNGGFWDSDNHGYTAVSKRGETAHPLGSELWSYAPMNLLPHLRWLTEPDYPHVYYMDGDVQSFDANIFTPDADHPNGWGTILIAGMGLGGGAIDMMAGGQQHRARSAYVVLDITNPEKPPSVLAEITAPSLGFATSQPALIKQRIAGAHDDWLNPVKNEWYLAFASGPESDSEAAIRATFDQGASQQNLQVFIYDLQRKEFVSGFDPMVTAYSNSYGGDLTAVDWNKDFQDDAIYFGSVEGAGLTLSGAIHRLKINGDIEQSSLNVLLNTGQPMVIAPLTVIDNNDYWIYGGTGRLLISSDNKSTAKNSFYGVREPINGSGLHTYDAVSVTSLIDTTDVEVYKSGKVQMKNSNGYVPMTIGDTTVESFRELKSLMQKKPGWKVDLFADGRNPSGKNMSAARQFFSMILFNEHKPSEDSCLIEGKGYLHGLHYITGTSTPDGLFGDQVQNNSTDDLVTLKKVESDVSGYINEPIFHFGNMNKVSTFIQSKKGSIEVKELNYKQNTSGRQSWRQIFEVQ